MLCACCVVRLHLLRPGRGGLHPAVVLGAAAVGGPAPEGLPPLPVPERVAAEGEPQPENPALLQQGEGKSPSGALRKEEILYMQVA